MPAFVLGVVLPALLAIALLLHRTGGALAYPLDGPYVHLAMAEQMLRGHYGLNPGEFASPSSTIIFPVLLALLGAPLASPLLVSLVAVGLSGYWLYRLAEGAGLPLRTLPPLGLLALGASIALATNLTGLALAGMERAPHVALTLLSLLGLRRFLLGGGIAWWWLGAVFLLPLFRFEGMAAVLAEAVVLLAFGRWRHALGLVLGGVAVLAGFGLFLQGLGLPWLPQSVIERSLLAGAEPNSLPRALWTNLRVNLVAYGGAQLVALMVALAWGVARSWPGWDAAGRAEPAARTRVVIGGFGVLVLGAQLLGGSLVSVSRYEVYATLLGLGALLVVFDTAIATALRPRWIPGICLSLLALGAGQVLRTPDAVKAAVEMHRTDDVLARFLAERWPHPVMTTRPGRLNWRAPAHVSAITPAAAPDAAAEALAARHGVGLALIEERRNVPAGWVPVGRLGSVVLHATRPEAVAPAADAVRAFGAPIEALR